VRRGTSGSWSPERISTSTGRRFWLRWMTSADASTIFEMTASLPTSRSRIDGTPARLSTLFRFAQYLGWTEIIYGYSDRLRFESDEATKSVTKTLGDIGWILAADEFDRTDEGDFTTSQFMLWRDEQRAIGELMRHDGDEPRCIGFNSFVESYDQRFSKWFSTFASQLEMESAPKSNRLAELHRVMARLVQELDVDRLLVQFDRSGNVVRPLWARPSTLAPPTKHTERTGSAGDLDTRS
jgi:hypothetical protein